MELFTVIDTSNGEVDTTISFNSFYKKPEQPVVDKPDPVVEEPATQ